MDNNIYKNVAVWIVIGLVTVGLISIFADPTFNDKEISFSEFINSVENRNVRSLNIKGKLATGEFTSSDRFKVYLVEYPDLFDLLRKNGVTVKSSPEESESWFVSLLVTSFPLLLIVALWLFFMRQMQNGGSRALSFSKSKARMIPKGKVNATFKDVAGVDEAKEDLQEVVEFLRDPGKFQRLGGKIPKGLLLMGSPGTGKTLLARAIAGEANVPFFSISGSDFVEMFVGVGASRVRDLFDQAKKNSPCIIFVDEIDAVGRHRGAGLGGGHDEREQTLNQLLVEMDGFESNTSIIVIAATNRPDVLDPALLRPGRFDRQIVVPRPDIIGREAILKVHSKNLPLGSDVNLKELARGTPGFTGADLANLCNEAALLAAREDADTVSMRHFEHSKDKVMMGAERRSMIISDKEKKTISVHETGHALVALMLDGTDPIHKVSIIPRGSALGVTQQLPVDEKHIYPKSDLLSQIAIIMGGRAAEDIVFNSRSTGAANDIEQATKIARSMVCEWGMSDILGPISLAGKNEQIFLGREIQQHRDFSEKTAIEIDQEVNKFISEAYARAVNILTEHRDILDTMTDKLLDIEVMEGKDVVELVRKMLIDKNFPLPENSAFNEDLQKTDDKPWKKKADLVKEKPSDGKNDKSGHPPESVISV